MTTLTTGKATEFITFTRASNATVTDSDGKVKWAPHNLLTNSESFDASAWTKTTVTPTANSIAAPNGTTTADTLAASGANGTALQSYTSLGVAYTFGVWLKRKTGTGNIQIAADSGTYTTVTITSDWALYTIAQTPAAGTISAGIRIVTSGDEVYAWGAALYRSDLAMQPNTSAYPMYNPTTPKNLLGRTEDYSGTGWARSNVTASGSIVAPNGLSTADTITSTSSVATDVGIYAVIGTGVGYTISIYAKAGTSNIAWVSSETSLSYAVFNLATQSVISSANGTPSITPVGDGWYRIALSNLTIAGPYFVAGGKDSYTSGAPWGNGTWTSGNTIYLWGAQLSDSASLDSYVPVYGAAVTSAAYYGPRRDFDGATLACKGLLVEEQRSNLRTHSSDFTQSSVWTLKASTTVNSTTLLTAAPSGAVTAQAIVPVSNGATNGVADEGGTYSTGRVVSFYAKAGTGITVITGQDGAGNIFTINLSTGTGTFAAAYTYNSVVSVGNGWYRVAMNCSGTGTNFYVNANAGANGTNHFFLWGVQLEAGSFATSYIPVGATTAGATRLADVAQVSTAAFPYSATEGTIVVNVQHMASPSSQNQAHWQIIGASNILSTDRFASSTSVAVRGLGLNADSSKTLTTNVAKVGTSFTTTEVNLLINGGSAYTNTSASGTLSGAVIFNIGNVTGTSSLNGWMRQVTYLPRKLSVSELQTRTQ